MFLSLTLILIFVSSVVGNISSSCQKYVILTTQRSGSTWTCSLFDLQNHVTCGGTKVYRGLFRYPELMITYSRGNMSDSNRTALQWPEYEYDLNSAIQDSIDANQSCHPSTPSSVVGQERSAAGFKLMYDQIPEQFIESGEIFDYFVKNDIAIIHLIREAKILNIASGQQSNGMPDGQPHTADESIASKLRKSSLPITWDETTVQKVLNAEEADRTWQRLLSSKPNLKYHRLIYEKMLAKEDRRIEFEQVFGFLNTNQNSDLMKLDSMLLQLHQPTCKGRVERYEKFYEAIAGTKTSAACKWLDKRFGDEESILV